MQPKHRYRVNVYLGKDNYATIENLANALGISVSQMTRVMIDTGLQIAKSVEGGLNDAWRK